MDDQTDEVSDFPVQTNDDQLALNGEEDKSGKKVKVVIGIVAIIGFLVIGIIIFLVYRYCKKKQDSPALRRGSRMIEGGLKRISTLGSRYNQVPSSEENKENNVISMTTTFDPDDEKCINFEGQITKDSNDNKVDQVDSPVGLRETSFRRQNLGSTYLDIDEDSTLNNKNIQKDEGLKGSQASLGILSTHSSQHLSMGDVEAKSLKLLSSNDELDESSITLNAAPVPEPEDTLSPLIGVNKYKQKKIKSKRSFRSKEAYQNQNRPFSDGTLDDEPPTVPPKQSQLCRSAGSVDGDSSTTPTTSEDQKPTSPLAANNPNELYPIPVYSFSPRLGSTAQLHDYDDLPTDHKPILPPKIGNFSTSNLAPLIDPVQLELQKRIMSKSATNIRTIPKTLSTYNTLQVQKPSQNHLQVQPLQIPSSHQNNIENDTNLLSNSTTEPIPLPKKQNVKRKGPSDENTPKEEFEDYDLPVVKHKRPDEAVNAREEYEDYDEPSINHSLNVTANPEFEDYDQPIDRSKIF